MTKSELNGFRLRLETRLGHLNAERDRLRNELFHVEASLAAIGPPEPYTIDELSREKEQEEVAVAVLAAEDDELAECLAALERVAHGTFGRCERCGRAVSKHRLEALPDARLCIHCARLATA